MEGDDFEDYGFEYEDDEEEEQNVDIENKYYNSKDPVGALTGFAEVHQMETEKTKWCFMRSPFKFLEEVKNESLWFKINLKFCNILFHVRKYGQMKKILKELHKSSRTVDESDDQIKL